MSQAHYYECDGCGQRTRLNSPLHGRWQIVQFDTGALRKYEFCGACVTRLKHYAQLWEKADGLAEFERAFSAPFADEWHMREFKREEKS